MSFLYDLLDEYLDISDAVTIEDDEIEIDYPEVIRSVVKIIEKNMPRPEPLAPSFGSTHHVNELTITRMGQWVNITDTSDPDEPEVLVHQNNIAELIQSLYWHAL